MKKLIFSDIRQELVQALEGSLPHAGITEPVALVDGFVKDSLTNEVTGDVIIGGLIVPMVMLIGKKSGRVYLFALKILLPEKV